MKATRPPHGLELLPTVFTFVRILVSAADKATGFAGLTTISSAQSAVFAERRSLDHVFIGLRHCLLFRHGNDDIKACSFDSSCGQCTQPEELKQQ